MVEQKEFDELKQEFDRFKESIKEVLEDEEKEDSKKLEMIYELLAHEGI